MHVYSGAETQEGRHRRPRVGPAEGGRGESVGRAGGHAAGAGVGGAGSAEEPLQPEPDVTAECPMKVLKPQ